MSDVVLGLFLEVVSMQLTDALRMGAIRARPSSSIVSLHVASPALRAALPPNGFQLGPAEVDPYGRISTIRLTPTQQPYMPLPTRNAFQIAGLAVVPSNSHERVQLTPTMTAPMTMQLLAHMELAGVELSANFQMDRLVLRPRGNRARVTLDAQGTNESGTICEIAEVRLDQHGRIRELLLNPAQVSQRNS
jgi:hypothetical protein